MNLYVWAFIVTFTLLSPLTAQPPAPAAGVKSAGIVLDRSWDSPLQGNSVTMKELASLLSPFFQPKSEIPEGLPMDIYQGVTFRMPLEQAKQKLGITQRLAPKQKVVCPGLPKDSFYSYTVTGAFDGDYDQLHLVTDLADQIVAIELVCTNPKKRVLTDNHDAPWHTYNFIDNKVKAMSTVRVYNAVQYLSGGGSSQHWRTYNAARDPRNDSLQLVRIESEAISLKRGSSDPYQGKLMETVRWFVPRPLAELILYCTQKNG